MKALFLVLHNIEISDAQSDVNQALWLMKCAKYVMANGCPDVEVPSYSPFKSSKVIDRVGHMGALQWVYNWIY